MCIMAKDWLRWMLDEDRMGVNMYIFLSGLANSGLNILVVGSDGANSRLELASALEDKYVPNIYRENMKLRHIKDICNNSSAEDIKGFLKYGEDKDCTVIGTVHASDVEGALSRMATCILAENPLYNSDGVLNYIYNTVDIVIHYEELIDGQRKVLYISEITGRRKDSIRPMQNVLFKFEITDNSDGKIQGEYTGNGAISSKLSSKLPVINHFWTSNEN